jgi:hypothetical protein
MSALLSDLLRRLLTDSESRLTSARVHDDGAWQEILAEKRLRETLPQHACALRNYCVS